MLQLKKFAHHSETNDFNNGEPLDDSQHTIIRKIGERDGTELGLHTEKEMRRRLWMES